MTNKHDQIDSETIKSHEILLFRSLKMSALCEEASDPLTKSLFYFSVSSPKNVSHAKSKHCFLKYVKRDFYKLFCCSRNSLLFLMNHEGVLKSLWPDQEVIKKKEKNIMFGHSSHT